MLVKICGIKDEGTAHLAVEAGADILGFVFALSSRRITPHVAKKIIHSLPESIVKVGVFVNEDIAKVKEISRYCHLTALQLHGQESAEYCQQFKFPVIKAIKITEKGKYFPEPADYSGVVKFFLADTYQKKTEGGTGKTFSWPKANPIKKYGPLILAGGLNSENIYQALSISHPYGVDVSTGVETGGSKDIYKIRKFINEVRRWENEHKSTG